MLKSKDRTVINEAYLDRAMKILYSGTEDSKTLWLEDGTAIVKVKSEEIEDSYGNLEKIIDKKNTVTITKRGNFKIVSLDNSNFSVAIGDFKDEGYALFNKKMGINKKVISKRIGRNTFKRYIVEKVGNETFCAVYIIREDKIELIYFKRYDKSCNIDLEVSNTELINMSDEDLRQYAEMVLVSKYTEKIVDKTAHETEEQSKHSEKDAEDSDDLSYYEYDSESEDEDGESPIEEEEEEDDLEQVPHYENAIFLPDDIFSFDYVAVENRLPMVPVEDDIEESEDVIENDDEDDLDPDVLISEDTLNEMYEYASRFRIIEHGTELDECEKVDIITSLEDTIEAENEYLLTLIGYSGQINYEYDIRVDDIKNGLEEAEKQEAEKQESNNQDPSDDGENR